MRQRPRTTIQELRSAIECLPRATRVAMLEGIETNDIIAGAYTDAGGICPMLAAHRAGGRTSFISFARAWDRFAFRDGRAGRPRRATSRELLVLKSHLEASLLEEESPHEDLAAAFADHRRLLASRAAAADPSPGATEPATRPGDPDRSRELRSRPGWAWTRVVRRYDDYRRILRRVSSSPTRDATPRPPERVS
jgi:hypothetical protein